MIDLHGRTAVVTGAAQGIGAAIATTLAESGATVAVADVRRDAAQATADRIGRGAIALEIDVTKSTSVGAAADAVCTSLGRIDVWVNNAGIAEDSPALDLDDETWFRTIDVNLTGTFFGAREAARRMRATGGGSIVNISSIAGFRATRPEHHAAYDASKAAVAHLARVLAGEWATYGIRVNAVAPGYTNTTLLQQVGSAYPATMKAWLGQVPQGRLMEPAEIAAVVAFLASGVSSSVTGQVLHADGGYTIW